jgi:hypothetical protein
MMNADHILHQVIVTGVLKITHQQQKGSLSDKLMGKGNINILNVVQFVQNL